MAGRGFLKSQWAQKLTKKSEQPSESHDLPVLQEWQKPQEFLKPIEQPKSEEETKPPDEIPAIPKVMAPVISTDSPLISQAHALRGRRVIILFILN